MEHGLATIVTVRHEELLREAEMERLYQQVNAQVAETEHDPFYYEALAALGRRLSDFGCYLQDRYGECQAALEPVHTVVVQK